MNNTENTETGWVHVNYDPSGLRTMWVNRKRLFPLEFLKTLKDAVEKIVKKELGK